MNLKQSSFKFGPPTLGNGFALVISLSLMVLLTVIAVGLLTISSLALRTSSVALEQSVAKANARMALALALGDLQKHAGADTRITARADILAADLPPVTGVWKSWEGSNHDDDGRPVAPGSYKTEKENRFLSWLVSGEPGATQEAAAPPATVQSKETVTLLGAASVGEGASREKLQIHLRPSRLGDGKDDGSFAWWVSGENQKARLPKPYQPEDDSPGLWAAHLKSHAVADPEMFRMESLHEDTSPADKSVDLKQADLFTSGGTMEASKEFFHDLSATSVGLLTNSATGGWRKDLSLLTENWDQLSGGGLPLFRLRPGEDVVYDLPTSGNPQPKRGMLYPWSAYRNLTPIALDRQGPVASWQSLQQHATAYKRISASPTRASKMAAYSVSSHVTTPGEIFNYTHKTRIFPVVARIQWVFSHWAGSPPPPAAGQPAHPAGSLEPRLLMTPVVTMWNPYNVEITTPAFNLGVPRPLPVALRYTVTSDGIAKKYNYRCLSGGKELIPTVKPMADIQGFAYNIKDSFTLGPGETRVFSPAVGTLPVIAGSPLAMEPGYRSGAGHYFPIKDTTGKSLVASANATLKAEARFDTEFFEVGTSGPKGVGIYLDLSMGNVNHGAYRMVYTREVAQEIWDSINGLAESESLESVRGNPAPFMSSLFGARMASKTQIPAKGFVQSSPLVNFTSMGSRNDGSPYMPNYLGSDHPVNSPFDYSFEKLTAFDSMIPNADDSSGRGYIVTGFNKDSGLSRCVVNELPTRPIQSLAELTHWDLRFGNPIPPFAFNLIGNSDATPLLPKAAVVNSIAANLPTNLQHDDSYCANHLLFDDWFVSSIAPDPSGFGDRGRDMESVFSELVSGKAPLPNRAYGPLREDRAKAHGDHAEGSALFDRHVTGKNAWQTIASRLEVEGMFNVNSTSVTAWRALLGHARNQRIPYFRESSGTFNIALSGKTDHAVSRFSVSGSDEASQPAPAGEFSESNEFTGHRLLDDQALDSLADEIIAQVRARGPFLSLAEFVNRQLSSGDLALAGTIQAALNKLAKSGGKNLFATLQDPNFTRASGSNPRHIDPEYQFPEAAVGNSAYGLPGWMRQADILRPLAPILSARDDTFTIRAYGDARDEKGRIKARAVCEAVVFRGREFVDRSDAAELVTTPGSPVNLSFGRRFNVVSFRWLAAEEV